MKIFNSKTFKNYLGYGFAFLATFVFIILFVQNTRIDDFIVSMENKTFDLRQKVIANSNYKTPSKDIVIVTVDDASYEYLLEKYGEWPIPRNIYADLINYVEKQKPSVIAFDLMFVKSIKSKTQADQALVNAIKRYDNVFAAMNFDYQKFDVRKPPKLDKKFRVNVKNDSNLDLKYLDDITFTNCRSILPQILKSTPNVGMINASRSDDGILRKLPPFMVYQKEFYPHLALKAGLKYLSQKEKIDTKNFYIDKHRNLILGTRAVPIDEDGGAILNWYGPEGVVFQQVPLYKIIKAMEGDKSQKFDFKNKIVYVGVTATSLYDTKTVPVSKIYPGVEVHATYINNLIDNNFIKKVPIETNVLISVALALIMGIILIKTNSTLIAIETIAISLFGYIILSYYLMKFFNIWIAIILPITFIILTFVSVFIIKYILKARDFEHQYKLATTDGLTELYNHRYFQEQMISQVENCKRYNSNFSLILIDIDFFKKFNDTYGHQSGDAVLIQVAKRLKKNVRATDCVCRYGGEEITIILPNADRDEAIITAQKLCQVISEKPCKLANNQESTVTISLGVSTFPQDGESSSEIIKKADERLYFAKENGRNQVAG